MSIVVATRAGVVVCNTCGASHRVPARAYERPAELRARLTREASVRGWLLGTVATIDDRCPDCRPPRGQKTAAQIEFEALEGPQ